MTTITVRMDDELLNRFERISQKVPLDRSAFIRQAFSDSLEELEMYNEVQERLANMDVISLDELEARLYGSDKDA